VSIETEFVCPPIPDRTHDWRAQFSWHDGDDEEAPVGWGETEREAVLNLMAQAADFDGDDGSCWEEVIDLAIVCWDAQRRMARNDPQ